MLPLAILAAVVVILLTYKWIKNKPKLPPGPLGLPIIGTLHITGDEPHIACQKLLRKYGPTLGVKFATERNVVLHDAKTIRSAFSNLALTGRTATEAGAFIMGDKFGILQASGEIWAEQRKFTMRTLRDSGFGKSTMEEMILEEVQEFCDWLKKQDGAPLELKTRFSLAVVNALWRILTGERYEHDDPALAGILDKLDRSQNVLFNSSSPLKMALVLFYPRIAKLFPNYSGWRRLEEAAKYKMDLFERIIQEHSDTIQHGSPRDFVDMYLDEIQETKNKNSSFYKSVGTQSLRSVMSDLFFAGSETTSATLLWAIIYLLHNPEVQEKMYKELVNVIGATGKPRLNDRKSLPYMECVIMEVLRCSSILAIGAPHTSTENTKIDDFDIPKGTMVNANIYHVHHDPEIWNDPSAFFPERFINPDGTCVGRHDFLIPFSVGRRNCLGETLARDTLFLYIASIIQNFTITLPDNQTKKPSLVAKTGRLTLQPQTFRVSMKYRY